MPANTFSAVVGSTTSIKARATPNVLATRTKIAVYNNSNLLDANLVASVDVTDGNDVTFGNPSLRNERAREAEVGAEAGFLNGKVAVEATYYDRQVNDLLFFRPLATSTGFSRQFAPIGSMSNKGVELLVRTTNVNRQNLKWESTVTYTRNRNLVESLNIQDFQSAGGYPNRIRVGEPAGVFYGSYAARDCRTGALLVDSLGRYRRSNQAADMGATVAQRQAISGGSCNDSLNAVIGDPNPDWMGSLLNEFTIGRKLRVRVLLDGVFGNDVMNLSTRAQNGPRFQRPYARHFRVLGGRRQFREAPRTVGDVLGRLEAAAPGVQGRGRRDAVGAQPRGVDQLQRV